LVDLDPQIVLVPALAGFLKDDVSVKRIAFDIVRETYNGTFCHRRMFVDCIFNRCGTQVVARNNHHVVTRPVMR
jgi:hypothetical protein